jgi:hypothetical protein
MMHVIDATKPFIEQSQNEIKTYRDALKKDRRNKYGREFL